MACEPAVQTPGSDDVELEDILRHSDVPTVVIRKDSAAATDAGITAADDDANRLSTPAPMATFEVLSDVEESDMDEVTSLQDVTVDASESHFKSHVDDVELVANGSVEAPSVEVMDVNREVSSQSTDGLVPTLIFEDVDANNQTTLSSPECWLVDNDTTWQWTAAAADHEQGT